MGDGLEQTQRRTEDPEAIRNYNALKTKLLRAIDSKTALEQTEDSLCRELREKLESNAFNLVVVGQFKRGKTCLINALLGRDILPMAVIPLTSIVTILAFGEQLRIEVAFQDGTVETIAPEDLSGYVTESGNPENVKHVREVLVFYPSAYLRGGVRLIDTPGVGSVYIHNTDVAYQYLPKSDAAVFLLSVEQPASKAELDFLSDVREYSDKIFFLLNKIDYLTEEEVNQSIGFSKQVIKGAMGSEVKIFPISARLALDGQMQGSEELLGRSRLPEFSEMLSQFLTHDKGKILLRSIANNLLRILSQARLEMELELKSLTAPIQELREKVAIFEDKKEEILAEKRNFDILIDGEVNRFVREKLDADIAAFKSEFAETMEERFDTYYQENRDLTLKELNDTLESFVLREVEFAFTAWRTLEEQKVADGFQKICNRFIDRINDTVDLLLSFSSQLFSVPFDAIQAESLWSTESSFRYKLSEEAVGLDLLESSLTQVWPRYISDRFQRLKAYLFQKANERIVGKRRSHMLETIEMQAGRARHDFIERLSKSKAAFRREVLERLETTADGISRAIEKGLQLRSKGESEAGERKTHLSDTLARIDALRTELAAIREEVSRL